MDQFETLMASLGELGIQAILENWERSIGLQYDAPLSLEGRWQLFLCTTNDFLALQA